MSNELLAGLPDGWSEDDVPSGQQLEGTTLKALKALEKEVAQSKLCVSPELIGRIYDTVCIASEFENLLPDAVDFALSLRDLMRGAGRNDLWYAMFMRLSTAAMRYVPGSDLKQRLISQTLTEVGKVSGYRAELKNAIVALKAASDYSLSEEERLIPEAEYLAATYSSRPLPEIESEAFRLLVTAKTCSNLYAQMLISLNLSAAYDYYQIHDKAFIYSQQSLVIANNLNKPTFVTASLIAMMRLPMQTPHLTNYTRRLIDLVSRQKNLASDLRLQAWFYIQAASYLYCKERYADSLRVYRIGIPLVQKVGSRTQYAHMLHGLGQCLTKLQKYEEAEAMYHQVHALYIELDQKPYQLWIQHCLGWNSLKQGDFKIAVKRLEQALLFGEKLLDDEHLPRQQLEAIISCLASDLDVAREALSKGAEV
jgi:tetratricopeptide (TPR) repeat protein